MTQFEKYYLMFCLSILAGVGLVAAYWLYYPYQVLVLKTPIHVVTKTLKPGGLLIYEVEYCKYMNLPAQVTRQLIDTEVHFFPPVTSNLPVGCSKSRRTQELPTLLASDYYHLHITNTYQVNPLRTMTYSWDTEVFEVTK